MRNRRRATSSLIVKRTENATGSKKQRPRRRQRSKPRLRPKKLAAMKAERTKEKKGEPKTGLMRNHTERKKEIFLEQLRFAFFFPTVGWGVSASETMRNRRRQSKHISNVPSPSVADRKNRRGHRCTTDSICRRPFPPRVRSNNT